MWWLIGLDIWYQISSLWQIKLNTWYNRNNLELCDTLDSILYCVLTSWSFFNACQQQILSWSYEVLYLAGGYCTCLSLFHKCINCPSSFNIKSNSHFLYVEFLEDLKFEILYCTGWSIVSNINRALIVEVLELIRKFIINYPSTWIIALTVNTIQEQTLKFSNKWLNKSGNI